MNLTPSKEHYIKTIYLLSDNNQGVQITEIADNLEVTKASACIAMKVLQEDDFIYRDEKRQVFLTLKGEKRAIGLMKKYEIIKCFLIEVLQIDSKIATKDACAMEHVVSPETLSTMSSMIQHCL